MPIVRSDLLGAETFSPLLRSPLVFLGPGDALPTGGIKVLVDRAGQLPQVDPADFDSLVTTSTLAPAPWASVHQNRIAEQLRRVSETAGLAPIATSVLARILRFGEHLEFDVALEMESLAYSALLAGGEFAAWRAKSGKLVAGRQTANPVCYSRGGNLVTLTLNSPSNQNAMTAAMRDALFEGLVNVLEDPGEPDLLLQAEGRCFSTGGLLAEFGSAHDLAAAHIIRTQHSCARVLNGLGGRATVRLHGACVGSGIEIAAAAARRIAASNLMVQLPELRMGLVPGAGGTASVAKAIGRHRLLWLALGAFRIGADQARDWGLIHAIES